jgi:hypothetical protein
VSTLKRTKHNSLDIRLKGDIISVAFVTLPLLLSAFTHIWNPVGSPGIHDDEGHYIRRAIHVSEGFGAQERDRGYDHPYFGWLFLGSIFSTSGYPDSLNPKPGDVSSVEALWSIPRIIVGALAVVDTFLIYKIAQIRYSRTVAFIAAVLFAVMPSTWFIRSVFLETLQLPLILLSILFAVSYEKSFRDKLKFVEVNICNKLPFLLLPILSGTFLGLAIFTKIPAFTFIPVVAYLIVAAGWRNRSRKRVTVMRLRNLALWFIPVILVPMLWPIYAISADGYDNFIEGINFQMTRSSRPLLDAMLLLFSVDPVLLTVGVGAVAYCAVKREFLSLIWIVPSLIFYYILDYVSYFFLIPLIPAFCISSAVAINDLTNVVSKGQRRRIKQILPFAAISVMGIFGLVTNTALVASEKNSSHLEAAASTMHFLPNSNPFKIYGYTSGKNTSSSEGDLTIISSPALYWIVQYVFDKHEYDYRTQYSLISTRTLDNILRGSEKVLMVADSGILEIINHEREPDNERAKIRAERLSEIYNSTELVAKLGTVEIRTNYLP